MIINIFLFLALLIPQNKKNLLIGKWQMQSYNAIEKIKSSPAYMFGDENLRSQIDIQFKLSLDSTVYNFKKDTLFYTSIEGINVVHRVALWKLKSKIIFMDEIKRSYKRQAHLHFVSNDSLVISPVINGKIGSSKMIFLRIDGSE